ncbi:hypothetical protein COB57_03450 [Candidatus Peregrinibacteria bacterium]|nr:MAG: hypothetical protein COB57_03450 [Candidatus Peregrinibacteria bacterium]
MKIQRTQFCEISSWIGKGKILILRGPRQVGKTTLMKQLQDSLKNKKTVFITMDSQKIIESIKTSQDLYYFLEYEHNYHPGEELYLFLDEFQVIPNAGLFLKNIFDEDNNIHCICSGSSSLEITKTSEFLTGRKIVFDIKPFSFNEFLSVKKFKPYKTQFSLEEKTFIDIQKFFQIYSQDLHHFMQEYLLTGGYPEVVLRPKNEKALIQKDIVNTYIEKDITQFLQVENTQAFNNLIILLASQIGSMVNKSELSTTIGISINTINKYLKILEGTFVLEFVTPFFTNKRKELTKMPKVFFTDTGLRNFLLYGHAHSLDISEIGSLVENFVYNELRHKSPYKLQFYHTVSRSEIDFIFSLNIKKIIPIEVKYRNKVTLPVAMKNFIQNYKDNVVSPIIITKDICKYENGTYFIPASILSFIELK